MMKRLYICSYGYDSGWISGIVATSHQKAKVIFLHAYNYPYDYEYIDIRVNLFKPEIDVSKLPIGEIDYNWGLKNGIYNEE